MPKHAVAAQGGIAVAEDKNCNRSVKMASHGVYSNKSTETCCIKSGPSYDRYSDWDLAATLKRKE